TRSVTLANNSPRPFPHKANRALGTHFPGPSSHTATGGAHMTNTQTSQGHTTARTLRRIWHLLREREPQLPAVAVNVVPTIGRTNAWLRSTPSLGDTHVLQARPDALAHRPREVVCQVAHEATHALAHALGVADTSKR